MVGIFYCDIDNVFLSHWTFNYWISLPNITSTEKNHPSTFVSKFISVQFTICTLYMDQMCNMITVYDTHVYLLLRNHMIFKLHIYSICKNVFSKTTYLDSKLHRFLIHFFQEYGEIYCKLLNFHWLMFKCRLV